MHVDTSNREWFVAEVAQRLGLGRWPIGQDGEQRWQEFKAALPGKLREHGQSYVEADDRPEDRYRVPTAEEIESSWVAWRLHLTRPRA